MPHCWIIHVTAQFLENFLTGVVFAGEYLHNLCSGTDPNCAPCIERLPSCIGLPDGNNPVLNRTWLAEYIYCYKERTLDVRTCPSGSVFDPYRKQCVLGKF